MNGIPVEPFHPGEYIQEALEARNWRQEDLAEVLGKSRLTVLRLLNGQTGVTPDMAHALAKALDTSPEVWMNLQTAYELSKANKQTEDVERRAAIYSRAPVRDMKKRGWIPEVENTDDLERCVCDFLRIKRVQDTSGLKFAARKSTAYDVTTPAQEAWFCRSRMLAETVPAAQYQEDQLEEGITELRKLAAYPEDTRSVPKVLASIGIRFVVVEPLPHAKVDGVAFWLDEQSPAIAMSLRYDRIDNFWFTLMHEVMHIMHRHNSPIDADLTGGQSEDDPEIERVANVGAINALVPEGKLSDFILRKRRVFSQVNIVKFATVRGVHPGIVVGLLHGRGELDFKFHRKMLVKVRSEIVPSALVDGWGRVPNLEKGGSE